MWPDRFAFVNLLDFFDFFLISWTYWLSLNSWTSLIFLTLSEFFDIFEFLDLLERSRSWISAFLFAGLLDPKWIEQRDRTINEKRGQEEVFAPGGAIAGSLKQLSERRTDIFGVGAEETQIGKKVKFRTMIWWRFSFSRNYDYQYEKVDTKKCRNKNEMKRKMQKEKVERRENQ